MSNTLVALKQLGSTEASTGRLKQMREELDQSLEVARSVEARVNRLMKETDLSNN